MTDKYKVEYVLDVTKPSTPYFVPVVITKKGKIKFLEDEKELADGECNGVLIGTHSDKGVPAILKWYKENPDWEERYFPNE